MKHPNRSEWDYDGMEWAEDGDWVDHDDWVRVAIALRPLIRAWHKQIPDLPKDEIVPIRVTAQEIQAAWEALEFKRGGGQ